MEKQRIIQAFLIGIIFFQVLLTVKIGGTMDKFDYCTYVYNTGEMATVKWDPVTGATGYIYRVKSFERNALIKIEGQAENQTEQNQFTFAIPFMGHFIVEVRATDGQGHLSEWSTSTNPDSVLKDDNCAGWWIYGRIAPAGQIEINSIQTQ